jgi:hypothetical protein
MNNHYKLSMGLENDSIGLHGIGSQIRAAAALMQSALLQGDEVYPEMVINGCDIFGIIFDRKPKKNVTYETCPCETLPWSLQLEQAHCPAALNHLKWSNQWVRRCKEKLRKLGNPTKILSLRGTDKIDGCEMFLPTFIYQELILSSDSPILILSDTSWGMAELYALSNSRNLNRKTSDSLFPLHRTRMMDKGLTSSEDILAHTLEMFEDIYILGEAKTIYYPVWHGVLAAGLLLSDKSPSLVCLQDHLTDRERVFVDYYNLREKHFWNRIDL